MSYITPITQVEKFPWEWSQDQATRTEARALAKAGNFEAALQKVETIDVSTIKDDALGDIAGCASTQGDFVRAEQIANMISDDHEKFVRLVDIANVQKKGVSASVPNSTF